MQDLGALSYAELRNFCSTLSRENLDCDWKLWREKAKLDFAVSERFFDLVRTISGPQRYLQIKTYYKLTPDSAARVYSCTDSSCLEGVYTSLAGYLEAQVRGDHEMGLFFYSRLKEHEKALVAPPEHWSEKEEPLFSSDRNLLYQTLESGDVKQIDSILHTYFTLPSGYSIERDVLKVPFWKEAPLYNIPLLDEVDDKERIMHSALVGLNTQVVDFFRSLFRSSKFTGQNLSIEQGLLRHGRAEDAYSLALRFPGLRYNYMVEMLVNPKLNSLQAETFISAIDDNPGNVALLTSLLPYVKREKIENYYASLGKEWRLVYRLPSLILQGYIANA
jgi:hypothetical protein